MATQIRQLRGTAAENNAYTGAAGVITVDETNKDIRVHDGQTMGGFPVAGRPGNHQFPGTGAVNRTVNINLNKFPTPDDYGADPTGVADSSVAFQRALAANRVIYIKNNAVYLVSSAIALSATGHSIIGDGHGQGEIVSKSATASIITLASGVAKYKLAGFSVRKSVTPTAGFGINFLGSTDLSEVSDVSISACHTGLRTSTTDQSRLSRLKVTKCIQDGWFQTNETNYGPAQWEVSDILLTQNGRDGVRVQAQAGPSNGSGAKGLILGTWNSLKTFANSSCGVQILGSAGGFGGVYDMRLNNPFIGSDAIAGIRIDGYGGKHVVVGGFIERCGLDPTGPSYSTAPSNNANGMVVAGNETDTISLSSVLIDNNALSGLRMASGILSLSGVQALGNGQALKAGDRSGISIDGGTASIAGGKSGNYAGGSSQQYGVAIGVDSVNVSGVDLRGNSISPVFRGVTLTANNSSLAGNTPPAANGLS